MSILYRAEQMVADARDQHRPQLGYGRTPVPFERRLFLGHSKPGRGVCSHSRCTERPVVALVAAKGVGTTVAYCATHDIWGAIPDNPKDGD